ncbi:hypothetical protein [Truepera radiovictrix]|uniref:Uncharacterized protein n=1 Tax=Truepera radiovictrix (strain DSM 17093 / CIP 108686 / LMG 22925 / RQ-24) TaxID=649638 RepID=D7CW50_TRURR|nr:hypothetical protein [Truepera radiovictrix]ADI14313.1 conserved hypothetical protein [Truepera radiovictrix DSM 17093]WMT57131.1 hypothetical protein RCV51_14065 [Truepera radiovictrix]
MSQKLWNRPSDPYYLLFIGAMIFLLEVFNGGSGWLEAALLALVAITLALPVVGVTRWLVRKMVDQGSS